MIKFLNSLWSSLISLKFFNQTPPKFPIKDTYFNHLFRKELFVIILKQVNLFPSKITNESLRCSGKIALNIALTNKKLHHYLKNTLVDLSKMYSLYCKYSFFNSEYENPCQYTVNKHNFLHPPILIDALNSGCRLPLAFSSYDVVNFDDIKEIIRLMPETIYSDLGKKSGLSYCETNTQTF